MGRRGLAENAEVEVLSELLDLCEALGAGRRVREVDDDSLASDFVLCAWARQLHLDG